MLADSATDGRFAAIPRSAAQLRVLDAALALISERGVSATSLQMIADRIGVTKAAVYHQFRTKDEIVIALTERELGGLEDVLEAAEAETDRVQARELLLRRVVDLAIERRTAVSVLQFDPVIVRLLAEHQPFQRFIDRLYTAMLGDETGSRARLHAAMLSGVISVAVMHPLVVDIDDDTLRAELLQTMRRIVDLPG
ncbi:TetR/AcrR family transcriptional regulator [Mycobacterium sp. NPDC050041]|uniref:TetR/AcrR family transcriptional regulator n=1 Tax=Mycobacterium sp. NPDC050041 TaxID=3364293 RepID=UPI003C2B195C